MTLPEVLPCKCLNPSCGYSFYARNPVGGGGSNISFVGNATNCPRCGQMAQYSDWNTDSQGKFQLDGFFGAVRRLKNPEKIETLKADLESANDSITAEELSDVLVAIDPSFQRFSETLRSIPFSAINSLVQTLVAILTLLVIYQNWQSTQDNHQENIELQREQFEYQKLADSEQARDHDRVDQIDAEIERLKRDFENRLRELERPKESKKEASNSPKPGLKGNCRNKPCPCGSGKKAKKCHPQGF